MNHRRPLEQSICLELERDLGRFSHPGNLEQVQLFPCKHQAFLWLHPSLMPTSLGMERAPPPAGAEPGAASGHRVSRGSEDGEPHAPTLHKDPDLAILLLQPLHRSHRCSEHQPDIKMSLGHAESILVLVEGAGSYFGEPGGCMRGTLGSARTWGYK